MAAAGMLCAAVAFAAQVETAPTFRAGEILAPELAQSEHHRVAEGVRNDGFMNLYRIESERGVFEARGEPMLALRVHEVHALAQLAELSKTEVFRDAAASAVTAQAEAIRELAENPRETIRGVPGGMKRMFKKYKRDAREGYETAKEVAGGAEDPEDAAPGEDDETAMEKAKKTGDKAADAGTKHAKRYVGVTGAERMWAQRLEVDPYTSNEILKKEIKKVARVSAAGGFAMRFAPIPRIPGMRELHKVYRMVWTLDPRELAELNIKRLAEMGADEELIAAFVEHPVLTPSLQTGIVGALVSMDGATDRAQAVEQAVGVETEPQAAFFAQSLAMLAANGARESAIERLLGRTRVPVALAENGKLVACVSVDHISWTAEVEEIAGDFADAYADLEPSSRELRLRGTASELIRQQQEARGWTIVERVELEVVGADEDVG